MTTCSNCFIFLDWMVLPQVHFCCYVLQQNNELAKMWIERWKSEVLMTPVQTKTTLINPLLADTAYQSHMTTFASSEIWVDWGILFYIFSCKWVQNVPRAGWDLGMKRATLLLPVWFQGSKIYRKISSIKLLERTATVGSDPKKIWETRNAVDPPNHWINPSLTVVNTSVSDRLAKDKHG